MAAKAKLDRFFEISENLIYLVIGVLLLITILFLIYDVVESFFHYGESADFMRWVVEILDKVLLMLMVIEILYTIRVSYKEHTLCAEPFLIVAMIAGIRRILVISVETAHLPERFEEHMIEIAILGVLIFIFVVSILLLRKKKEETGKQLPK